MTKEQEKETIKYLEFLQKEFLEDAKRRKENGEITGYGTMEDIDKLRALHIGFALEMLKENSAEIEQKNTELAEKNAEIERLNRQINLITEFLGERDLGYYKNETGGEILGIMRKYNKEDWKQYFERKK